jgi:hypothetical protein
MFLSNNKYKALCGRVKGVRPYACAKGAVTNSCQLVLNALHDSNGTVVFVRVLKRREDPVSFPPSLSSSLSAT